MSSSVGPEMKFFRWILSHLSIIVVLSAILYFYWSQYGFWSEEHTEAAIKPTVKLSEQALQKKVSSDNIHEAVKVNNLPVDRKAVERKTTELQMAASSYSSSDFSKRMNEYKQRLSAEQQKMMDDAGRAFQQETKSIIQYPTDDDIKPIEKSNIAETEDAPSRQVTLKEKENKIAQLSNGFQEENTEVVHAKETVALIDKKAEVVFEKKAEAPIETKAEALFEKKAEALIETKAEAPIEIKADVPDEIKVEEAPFAAKANSEVEKQYTGSLAAQKTVAKAHDKKLQQQIRDRQKQLQEQMVLLIPLDVKEKIGSDTNNVVNNTNNVVNNTNIKTIEPLIHTPEQNQLLNDARHAFDLRNFKVAEKKYLQLIKQLPEFPDVVGELANVYKTQDKIPDYLVTNTQFVKRLVNHNRFNEAWKVVLVTDKIDKKIANKQRRIINNKQKEL